ncbi:MAG: GTPase HflX [Thermodesulfobacteriota bacterium]
MAKELAALSREISRQIGVLITRNGKVDIVVVGDQKEVELPNYAHLRTAGGRLKGLRCVHTHLGGEDITEDDLMDLLFLRLDLMSMIKVRQNGLPERLYTVHLQPSSLEGGENFHFLEPIAPTQQETDCQEFISALEEEFARGSLASDINYNPDRALLISVTTDSRQQAQEYMDELVELARSDDIEVLETIIQRRDKINPKFIMGKGKLSEIMLKSLSLDANLLIFDQELNPSQVRSITDHTHLRVIDRTQLILDIFARRALSSEGKLQIEIAQLRYMLPRLGQRDDAMSRLTGGIGGRGPGETKLEIDRRRINERLTNLNKRLKKIGKERHQRRSRRRQKRLPVFSLVGYTNAGKSTLLNSLTRSAITAEDKLFATLDPTSRRLRLSVPSRTANCGEDMLWQGKPLKKPSAADMEVIITDTVGFIRNLPEELLKSFKATLEELHEADLIIHVIDISNPRFAEQVKIVDNFLAALGLDTIPSLRLLNKIDLVDPEHAEIIVKNYQGIPISAVDPDTFGFFLEEVLIRIERGTSGF